jgi:hypothetical protein
MSDIDEDDFNADNDSDEGEEIDDDDDDNDNDDNDDDDDDDNDDDASGRKRPRSKLSGKSAASATVKESAASGRGGRRQTYEAACATLNALSLSRCSLSHSLSLQVREMMYGFGDAKEPLASTVKVLEEIAVEYMTEMVSRTHSLTHAHLTAIVFRRKDSQGNQGQRSAGQAGDAGLGLFDPPRRQKGRPCARVDPCAPGTAAGAKAHQRRAWRRRVTDALCSLFLLCVQVAVLGRTQILDERRRSLSRDGVDLVDHRI